MNEDSVNLQRVLERSSEPGSLDSLRDIVELPPVSWWPPAPGWWVLVATVVAACAYGGWSCWRAWRANAYRRAARAELQFATSPGQIAAVLKRAALIANPRVDVASMTGLQWCDWLGTSAGIPISENVRKLLTTGVFREQNEGSVSVLTKFAVDWIDHHRDQRSIDLHRHQACVREAV